MPIRCVIKVSEYHDSVTLMEAARELTALPGVSDAAVVMATDANKGILRQAGLLLPEIDRASPNDLVMVVEADSERTADRALAVAGRHLAEQPETTAAQPGFQPRTVRGAARAIPDSNLAVISVPGQYAAGEAWEALRSGLHVLLFSDHVSIEDEVALKEFAAEHGLLMMGPDCGTAVINGIALGFANALPRGSVGIVAASGTGLQEVSTLLAKRGVGITQGIGTGGRDLREAVGGSMMLEGVRALRTDPETEVLVLISKPPSPSVAERILDQAGESEKPTIVCFLGGDSRPIVEAGAIPALTLQEAAYLAAEEVEGYGGPSASDVIEREGIDLQARAAGLKGRLGPEQRYLRGLFSGGTLASEAIIIWEGMLGKVLSNMPLNPAWRLADATQSEGHCAVDLGEDEFTVGRPHPMIDNRLRVRRLLEEARDPDVAVVVLDVVLGYGAHPNPTSALGPAISEARDIAVQDGRELLVISSVTGTEDDPQGLGRQEQALEEAGAIVASCNAAAARLAGFIVAP